MDQGEASELLNDLPSREVTGTMLQTRGSVMDEQGIPDDMPDRGLR